MNDRHDPYEQQFWGNTQKHTLSAYHQRWLLGGFAIGDDEELIIVRHPVDLLPTPYQAEATLASQTGLHILIKDTRNVVALKLTDEGGGAGDVIQEIDADGSVGAKLTSGGTWTDRSLAIYKKNMKDLTEKQIENILEKAQVYRFEYLKEPGVVYVSPEASEFHKLTQYGDGETLSPKTLGGVALRLVQWVWNKVKNMEERLTALEAKVAVREDNGETPSV